MEGFFQCMKLLIVSVQLKNNTCIVIIVTVVVVVKVTAKFIGRPLYIWGCIL